MTEEQREEHKEKKKDYGLEGYEYKQKKAAEQEARIKANEQLIDGQEAILSNQKGRHDMMNILQKRAFGI